MAKGAGADARQRIFGFIHDPDFCVNPISHTTRELDIWGRSLLLATPGAAVDVGLEAPPYSGAAALAEHGLPVVWVHSTQPAQLHQVAWQRSHPGRCKLPLKPGPVDAP